MMALDREAVIKAALPLVDNNLYVLEQGNREQLLAGKRATGTPIKPQYAWEAYARAKPPHPERPLMTPNLKDTGSFHRQLFAERTGMKVYFGSRDPKTGKLSRKYGRLILGANVRSVERFSKNIVNELGPMLTRNFMS